MNEMNKTLAEWLCFLVAMVLFAACTTQKAATQATSDLQDEGRRRYDYYYLEAVKSALADKHDDSFVLLKHCLEINPDAPEALFDLGLYYMGLSDSAQCARHLARAAELDSANLYYKEALASFFLRNYDDENAARVLEDMARLDSSRLDVLGELANIYANMENFPATVSVINRIEVIDGKSKETSMNKFQLYMAMGEEGKAFEELESLAADNPNDMSYRLLIGDQYLKLKHYDQAWEAYEKVKEKDPDNTLLPISILNYYKATGRDSLYKSLNEELMFGKETDMGLRALALSNYVKDCRAAGNDSLNVPQAYERALRVTGDDPLILTTYAVYLGTADYENTLLLKQVSTRLLEKEPDNELALNQLMEISYEADSLEKTIEYCNAGIGYYPEKLIYYLYKGNACFFLKRQSEAAEAFRSGLSRADYSDYYDRLRAAGMYGMLGSIYYDEGKTDSAFAAFDSCLVYDPKNIMCMNNYAYFLCLEKKNLEKAEQMSYQTIIAEPRNKTYLDTYAWIMFIMKRYNRAKEYIDRVVEGDLDDEEVSGVVLEHAGDIYYQCGDAEQALLYWKMAAEKQDDDTTPLLKQKIETKKYIEQ